MPFDTQESIIEENNELNGYFQIRSIDDRFRYAVGTKGKTPLFFLGKNPSKGDHKIFDPTMDIVRKIIESKIYDFDSFILFNIFPQRKALNGNIDLKEHNKNIESILNFITDGACVWAAYGDLDDNDTPYLKDCLIHILWSLQTKRINIRWKISGRTKEGKHKYPDPKGNPMIPFPNSECQLYEYIIPIISDEEKNRALENIYNSNENSSKMVIYKEKQELQPIWFECLREMFEEAEKKEKKEIEITSLELKKYAENKNIPNINLDRPRSINFAMHNINIFESDRDDELFGSHSDGNSTYKIRYRLPRKKRIEKQNLNEKYGTSVVKKSIIVKEKIINSNSQTSSEIYSLLIQKVHKLIIQINEYGKKGKMKRTIFKGAEILGLLDDIKNICTSRDSFKSFVSSLYILYREKTRSKNQNYINKNDHYYKYSFPDIFWEKEKITKKCMDNIIIIRTEYFHSDDDENLSQKTGKSFLDVIKELTDRRHIPETVEEFQVLQIKIINQFVGALEELLQMIKNEL